MLTAVGVALATCLIGLLTLLWAVFSRRVGSDPHCRRCEFNLSGTVGTPAGSTCPECGSQLDAPRALRTGRRPRRTVKLVVGIACLLLGLGGGGVAATRVNWQPYKPAWWLVRQMDSQTPAVAQAASSELQRRVRVLPKQSSQRSAVIKAFLKRHADITRPFGPRWEEVFFNLSLNDAFSAEQLQTVRDAAVSSLRLDLKEARVLVGEHAAAIWTVPVYPPADPFNPRIPLTLGLDSQGYTLCIALEPLVIRLNGAPVPGLDDWRAKHAAWRTQEFTSSINRQSPGFRVTPIGLPGDLLNAAALPSGRHTVEVEWLGRWISPDAAKDTNDDGQPEPIDTLPPPELILGTGRIMTKGTIVVVDPDKPEDVLKLETGDTNWPPGIELESAVLRVFRLPEGRTEPSSGGQQRVVMLRIQLTGPDAAREGRGFAHDASILVNGLSLPIGQQPVQGSRSLLTVGSVDNLPRLDRVDIVLTPDPQHAMRQAWITSFWNQPITLEDVPVVWDVDPMQPVFSEPVPPADSTDTTNTTPQPTPDSPE